LYYHKSCLIATDIFTLPIILQNVKQKIKWLVKQSIRVKGVRLWLQLICASFNRGLIEWGLRRVIWGWYPIICWPWGQFFPNARCTLTHTEFTQLQNTLSNERCKSRSYKTFRWRCMSKRLLAINLDYKSWVQTVLSERATTVVWTRTLSNGFQI
jgi:hypothetical protein